MIRIEIEREDDGRWLGEVPALPGVMAYGDSEAEVRAKVSALALRVIADRIEHGEPVPTEARNFFAIALTHGPPLKRIAFYEPFSVSAGSLSGNQDRIAYWHGPDGPIMYLRSTAVKSLNPEF